MPIFLFPYFFFITKRGAAIMAASLLLLGGCQHAKKIHVQHEADFIEIEPLGSEDAPRLLHDQLDHSDSQKRLKGGRTLEALKTTSRSAPNFERPFRLSFIDSDAEMIMRRIQDNTDIEWFAPANILYESYVTLDVTIKSPTQIYDLIDAIAATTGSVAEWRGKKVYFKQDVETTLRPVDGYLIRPDNMTGELLSLVVARFDVSCSNVSNFSVCIGDNAALDRADKFLTAVSGARGQVEWEIVTSSLNLVQLVETLRLQNEIVASQIGNEQWLVAANDGRYLDTLSNAVDRVKTEQCSLSYFEPQNVSSEAIALGLNHTFKELCVEASSSGGMVYYSAVPRVSAQMEAFALKLDRETRNARMMVLIVTDTEIMRAGLSLQGWDGLLPSEGGPYSVEFVGALSNAEGWRKLILTTDGKGTSSISQTDRVDGNVVVTDGGTSIKEVEERTVGLSITLNGVLTPSGYRGPLLVSDSSLDNDVTLSADCQSDVSIGLGQIIKVCSYMRENADRALRLLSISKGRASERYSVYAALMSHESANLDTLRLSIGEEN